MGAMFRSLLALLAVALAPLVVVDLELGDAPAAVITTLVGLLVSALLVALVRESRQNAPDGKRSRSEARPA